MSLFQSYYEKVGRLRLYSGNLPLPYFFEVPFKGPVAGPTGRARAGETLILDRGRWTPDGHYVSPPDDPLLNPLAFTCQFRLANLEPNYSKILTLIRPPQGASFKNIGGRAWVTTKGTTQILNSDPLGQVAATTPLFSDHEKHCVNVEMLWTDPQGVADKGFRWAETYFPPDRQVTEGVDSVMVDLTGEIYGAIDPISQFTAGIES
jgi:hypothetical protein